MTTVILPAQLAEAILLAAASSTEPLDIPVAAVGIRHGVWPDSAGGDPWTATIGTTHVSYRSEPRRRLALALEHLVAAATIPQLVEAREKHLAELDRQYLKSDEALKVLNYAKRQVEKTRPLTDVEANARGWFEWLDTHETGGSITDARECHDKWRALRGEEAENERITAFEDGRYVAKRQNEIPTELGWADYSKLTEPLRAAVDHLIECEITQ